MVKNFIIYIFIYTLLVGCDTQNILTNSECESDCFLDISAPSLQIDDNGYYHIEWIDGYYQTFSTLSADTGSDLIHKVYWDSNLGIVYSGEFISAVNRASYTDEGVAHTVLSIWENMIGDTLKIYAGYYDDCDFQHSDSIGVIVENEI